MIEQIIQDIESEIQNSDSSCIYVTIEGKRIMCAVVEVLDWFEEYKEILRKRYKE